MVWTSSERGKGFGNLKRYKEKWNPFNAKVSVCESGGWDPSVNLLREETMRFLEELKK